MDIKSVGIVGAGQMGNGSAHGFARAGYDVLRSDVSEEALAAARQTISGNMDRQVSRGRIEETVRDAALSRIATTLDLPQVGASDLIIEAATENEDIKNQIFASLVPHLGSDTILTSNTSSISITRLASRTDRPEKFMGFHFMNPVPVMQLVELIRGIATDAETYEALTGVVRTLGKTAASAEDFPAFILNRLLKPKIKESIYTLYAEAHAMRQTQPHRTFFSRARMNRAAGTLQSVSAVLFLDRPQNVQQRTRDILQGRPHLKRCD